MFALVIMDVMFRLHFERVLAILAIDVDYVAFSSVKWSVLSHLKSQPREQNFQAEKPLERSSPHHTRTCKRYQKHI